MHHIKHVKNSNEKIGFGRIMSLLNRKQIPVCKFHHKAIHDGKYDNISLSELYDTRIAQVENYLALYG
jgi:nicotine oxidoreductase